MQVEVTFREKGEVMTGWGQDGNLCGGGGALIILVVFSYMSMFMLRKVAELNT